MAAESLGFGLDLDLYALPPLPPWADDAALSSESEALPQAAAAAAAAQPAEYIRMQGTTPLPVAAENEEVIDIDDAKLRLMNLEEERDMLAERLLDAGVRLHGTWVYLVSIVAPFARYRFPLQAPPSRSSISASASSAELTKPPRLYCSSCLSNSRSNRSREPMLSKPWIISAPVQTWRLP